MVECRAPTKRAKMEGEEEPDIIQLAMSPEYVEPPYPPHKHMRPKEPPYPPPPFVLSSLRPPYTQLRKAIVENTGRIIHQVVGPDDTSPELTVEEKRFCLQRSLNA